MSWHYARLKEIATKCHLALLARISFVVFAVEGFLMVALAPVLGTLGPVYEAIADATLLTVLSSPIIFFWIIRPFLKAEAEARALSAEVLQKNKEKAEEMRLLSELNDWLQSCTSLNELCEMVAKLLSQMLPSCSGALYVYANSRDVLDNAISWNGSRSAQVMQPYQCWGLRRGRIYTHGENKIEFHCQHVGETPPEYYACIPILAHGDTVGLLHLEFQSELACDEQTRRGIQEQRRLAMSCAERISLALANVRLGEQLRDQSVRDQLTDLFNRRYMMETCRREFARARRDRRSVGILSIDVDHFKRFNDNFGHDAGDTVLRAVAACLKRACREDDVPCRFGGEEFVLLLPGADIDNAAERAEDLRAGIEAITVRYLDSTLPRITISVGVAAFPENGDTPAAVLRAADLALYKAKEDGRNRVKRSGGGSATQKADAAEPQYGNGLAVPCDCGSLHPH